MVDVAYDSSIPPESHTEALQAVKDVVREYIRGAGINRPQKASVSLVGEAFEVTLTNAKAHVARLRRITGYCSDYGNWNPAKVAELGDRRSHV